MQHRHRYDCTLYLGVLEGPGLSAKLLNGAQRRRSSARERGSPKRCCPFTGRPNSGLKSSECGYISTHSHCHYHPLPPSDAPVHLSWIFPEFFINFFFPPFSTPFTSPCLPPCDAFLDSRSRPILVPATAAKYQTPGRCGWKHSTMEGRNDGRIEGTTQAVGCHHGGGDQCYYGNPAARTERNFFIAAARRRKRNETKKEERKKNIIKEGGGNRNLPAGRDVGGVSALWEKGKRREGNDSVCKQRLCNFIDYLPNDSSNGAAEKPPQAKWRSANVSTWHT